MPLILPTWFKQRQGQAEAAGDNLYRLSGPNLRQAFIGVRQGEAGRWHAFLRFAADTPDAVVTESRFDNLGDAWEAAFELFRTTVVV
jgi:hypothetical protein